MTTERKKRRGIAEKCVDARGRTYFRARVFLDDGSLSPRIEIPIEKRYSKRAARLHVDYLQEVEDRDHTIAIEKRAGGNARAPAGETCDQWFSRYIAYQRECGLTDPTKRTRWEKWISPRIGPKPIASVTRDDIEDIRDALDRSIRAWVAEGKGGDRVSGKTAMNVWSALTSAFKAATASKRRDLRVLADRPNPCLGVEPPGDKDSRKARRKPFVYPKEAHAVFSCAAIPLEWRELHAIAAFTYLRPGELRVLTWSDVDLSAGLVHVTRAWDYNDESVKPPKTRNGVRRVPIEPSLLPLLRRMREGKEASALVVPLLSTIGEDHLAETFREHLIAADVTRVELHTTTRTHVQAVFRSWRDSGLTWLAMSGVGVDKIMRRAGHDMVQTTMGYVKQAEDLTGDLGTPFGPLPSELLTVSGSTESIHRVANLSRSLSGRRDLNPRRPPWQGGTLPLSYSRRRRSS